MVKDSVMKRNHIIFAMAALSFAVSACENNRDNALPGATACFLAEGVLESAPFYVVDEDPAVTLRVFRSGYYAESLTVSVRSSESALETYNSENATAYKALPQSAYRIEPERITLAGDERSGAFQVIFDPMQLVGVEDPENLVVPVELLSDGKARLVFTSSVAVYGLNKDNPSELHPADPFNDYGRSKWQAECMLQEWYDTHREWNIHILRPTVIFGEGNRGNVYNLLRQITSGRFLMVGDGENRKSMAYVGNVVAFIAFLIENNMEGYHVFNYIDKPDFTMNDLVYHVGEVLNKHIPTTHYPYWLGMLGGYCFDALAKMTGRKLSVSSVRVKKFCAVTQFDSVKVQSSGFKPAFSMEEGLRRTLQYEFGSGAEEAIN